MDTAVNVSRHILKANPLGMTQKRAQGSAQINQCMFPLCIKRLDILFNFLFSIILNNRSPYICGNGHESFPLKLQIGCAHGINGDKKIRGSGFYGRQDITGPIEPKLNLRF